MKQRDLEEDDFGAASLKQHDLEEDDFGAASFERHDIKVKEGDILDVIEKVEEEEVPPRFTLTVTSPSASNAGGSQEEESSSVPEIARLYQRGVVFGGEFEGTVFSKGPWHSRAMVSA